VRTIPKGRLVLAACAALAALAAAPDEQAIRARLQQLADLFRSYQINLRARRTGQKLSPAEQQFVARVAAMREQANVEFRKTHHPMDSSGITPLIDLGAGVYRGQPGGLYLGGGNVPRPDASGKIGLISIGYSNWTMEFSVFAAHAMADPERNPKVVVLDCAVGWQTTAMSAHADAEYYRVVDQRLDDAGLSPAQVQIVMLKVATHLPSLPFPWEVNYLLEQEKSTVRILQERFPNLKLLYATSRIYAGYADMALNPEPHAFETGFAVKWLVADQIGGKPELNYDPAKGAVRAPWIAWGPYLWADGVKGRKDGLQWLPEDVRENDHTHPSAKGCEKVAKLVDAFLKMDPTAAIWYVKR
jgi:hypothetical protein